MIGVELQPVDTWFFRDGTPFSMGNAPQENVSSVFPPHPATVVGAIRASIARSKGWDGRGRWGQDISEVIGDGPGDLGRVAFDGPFLLREGQPLFRLPRHVLGRADGTAWKPGAFLRPGAPVTCDLGEAVRLPEVAGAPNDVHELKPGDGWWMTRRGLDEVLNGRLPGDAELVPHGCLWSGEPRIGLQRDTSTRTAGDGKLYSTRHVRPLSGVSLGVRIAGLPSGWTPPFGQPLTLGGEGRLAECREWSADLALPMPSREIEAARTVTVVALSPVDLPQDVCAGLQPLNDLGDARVVSACLERPQRVGGWNSLARSPLPLRCVLAPGSTLFCEIRDSMRFAETVAASDGLVRIGLRQRWGFGLVALGVWPAPEERNR